MLTHEDLAQALAQIQAGTKTQQHQLIAAAVAEPPPPVQQAPVVQQSTSSTAMSATTQLPSTSATHSTTATISMTASTSQSAPPSAQQPDLAETQLKPRAMTDPNIFDLLSHLNINLPSGASQKAVDANKSLYQLYQDIYKKSVDLAIQHAMPDTLLRTILDWLPNWATKYSSTRAFEKHNM
uniref:Uncharacterized protein n=1 Tax=Romanomermis culicivorax TaxID=13658 RepID=A0A915HM67_ROMCU